MFNFQYLAPHRGPAHTVHAVASRPLACLPGVQSMQMVLALPLSVYFPGMHCVQPTVPLAGAYLPFGHSVHVFVFAADTAEYLPVGQSVQVLLAELV